MDENEHEKGLTEYLAALRRRWRAAALVFVSVAVVGGGVAIFWPPVYRSTATILIEQQEIPQDLVRSTITSFADQRIQMIKQRVMTTANLLDIIRKHGLYADRFEREPREEIIDRMRKDIHMEMISANVVDPRNGRPTEATIAFTVGYDNRSPQLAVSVANELTSLYLQENSQTRREQATEASKFLTDEAQRVKQEVSTLEGRLAELKKANADRLPELEQLNQQLLDRTEQDLADVRRQRRSVEERKAFLESQLAQMNPRRDLVSTSGQVVLDPADQLRSLEAYLASIAGIYKPDHPNVVRTRKRIAALRKQLHLAPAETVASEDAGETRNELETLEAQRTALLERYKPEHPDVVRLDRQIEAARARLSKANKGDGATDSSSDLGVQTTVAGTLSADKHVEDIAGRATNPAYIQLQAQLASDDVELKSLGDQEKRLKDRVSALEARLAQTPAVQRDYDAIASDLDNARMRYREISAKQMDAKVAQKLEMDDKAERFNLIEPPLLPERPVSPNRILISFFGFVLAFAASLATVAVKEGLDGSVRDTEELQRLTGVTPLGIIPVIRTLEELRVAAKRRLRVAFAAAGSVLVLVVLAYLFAPVDGWWFLAMRHLGG